MEECTLIIAVILLGLVCYFQAIRINVLKLYMLEHGYRLPTDSEEERYARAYLKAKIYAIKRIFK